MDLKEASLLGPELTDHWYYRSKAAAMMKLLPAPAPAVILDVGAGSGYFSRYLLRRTTATVAWCIDTGYDSDADTEEAGKAIHYRRSLEDVAEDTERRPLPPSPQSLSRPGEGLLRHPPLERVSVDLVLLMDVLEHVDDDVGLLTDCVRKVPGGARFLVSVPAFRFLWSGHDEFLGHQRRYTLDELQAVVRRAGLRVRQGAYYFGLVFPLAAAIRLADNWLRRPGGKPAHSQLRRHGRLVNETLAAICKAELPLLSLNRVVGLSAFCVAERP
ncbi:class I SAM-dependent methyltransferase [Candidatus Thiosymbion oneisti]|uniref:class I SAM-dependent methyltransferase n=1 Tax=Candidatus Thiosymbion oneisti TaxID=589554 RepID=UPI000B03AF57|nr:methyltransferase domain-containing protein [Candidatus Thiosymbion oneisti]